MADDNDKPTLTRRRALGGLATIGAAGALGAGTTALFNDTEKTGDLTLAAGQIDLLVDYHTDIDQGNATPDPDIQSGTLQGEENFTYKITDVKPGDSGILAFCPKIVNNPAYLWVGSETGISNDDNGLTEPESVKDDTGGKGEGELGEKILVDASLAGSVNIVDGEVVCSDTHTIIENIPLNLQMAVLKAQGFLIEPEDTNGDDTDIYPPSPNASKQIGPCLCIEWELPENVGNVVQTDSVELSLKFMAEQARHNDNPTSPFA